jgi:hypothetical protein
MKKGLMLGVVALFLIVICTPDKSDAVPSYARQVQKPCTACHTIWPNLNQYGRQFKVKAYTDVSEKWEMINKDNMNFMTILPVSGRVLFFPEITNDTGPSSTELDQVALFLAGRLYDYAGVFASAEFSPDDGAFGLPTVKVAFQYPLDKGNSIGLVAFKGLAASADPFNSLGGRDRDLAWGDESKPFVLRAGWTLNFWNEDNLGYAAHGYFIGNRLYAAVGAMRGGKADDPSSGAFANSDTTDPYDMFYRVAWDQKLPNGAVTAGIGYYDGKQRFSSGPDFDLTNAFDSKVKRTYVDLSLEQNFGEDHMVELQALYGSGKETNVFGGDEERKFDGFYIQGSYFYDRMIGLVVSQNDITFKDALATDNAISPSFGVDKVTSTLVSLNYLPWLNTKVALQYVTTKTTFIEEVEPDVTDKITRVVMDILF